MAGLGTTSRTRLSPSPRCQLRRCHKSSFTTWTNGRLHVNYSISTGCLAATRRHLNAVGKPSTPRTVTGNCESCHKTGSWSTVIRALGRQRRRHRACDTCHKHDPKGSWRHR
jgi:hypothetical protein